VQHPYNAGEGVRYDSAAKGTMKRSIPLTSMRMRACYRDQYDFTIRIKIKKLNYGISKIFYLKGIKRTIFN
jgi:hypothetical protein